MPVESKQKEKSFFSNSLQYVKPFAKILPQINSPLRTPSLREKFIWTALSILVYLVASQVPLFGIINSSSQDPLAWMRMMMASNRGTLMDLGISPVVTSSMVMQFLTTIGIIDPDFSVKEDKYLYDVLQKLIALIMTLGQSIAQIASGFYGSPKEIGIYYTSILLIQLLISGIIIVLLDELLQKGYGLGNGVNLFIVTNVCERIVWNAFSPKAFYTGRGIEFEGCIIAFFHLLVVRRNKFAAFYEIFFRENLPNMFTLLATISMFCLVVYLQALKVELPIISRKHRGLTNVFPVHLLYTSTMPVIVQGYFVSHTSTISRFLFNYFPNNKIIRFFGVWEMKPSFGYIPVSGLCYYLFPPTSFSDAFSRPFFFTFYLLLMLFSAAFISKGWLDTHEENSESVFNKLKNQDMQLKGTSDASAVNRLNEYIPVAAFLGGLVTSAVIVFCDIASTMGSGNNIFLAASIIREYMKLMAKETAKRSGKSVIE